MYKFTYSFPLRILYRYGNIPLTILLSFFLVVSAANLDSSLYNLFPVAIILLLIYFLNKQYLVLYKILPYKIEADNEKLICSDFAFSKKKFIIFFSDISKLTGGIFEGSIKSLMKIYADKSNICIGFFPTISNAKTLQTIILKRINQSLYDKVMAKAIPAKKVSSSGNKT
jgi:hypothetical protein